MAHILLTHSSPLVRSSLVNFWLTKFDFTLLKATIVVVDVVLTLVVVVVVVVVVLLVVSDHTYSCRQ